MAREENQNIQKYINLFLLTIIIILLAFIIFRNKNSNQNSEINLNKVIRIGAGNDVSGLVLKYMDNGSENLRLEKYFIQDCWAPISQWALSSDAFDMAIVCKEAAKDFMTANPDFKIVAPVVMNSDIIVESKPDVESVGVTNNKGFHIEFAKDIYGDDVKVMGMNPNALPYAYGNGQIDAMIIDITIYNEETMPGKVRKPSDQDYVSNVLIANNDFMGTEEFEKFIEEYNNVVMKINRNGLPMKYIKEETFLNERSLEYWNVDLVKIIK